jgi:SAM-dependent methyltransferase
MCGAGSAAAFMIGDRNRQLGPGRFDYRRCERCATIFIAAVPADLWRYYASEGYGRYADAAPQVLGYERAKLAMLERHVSRGALVEVGPGSGTFARLAAQAGFEVTVIERDPAYAESLAGEVSAVLSDDPALALAALPGPADAIVMWHALEHLPQPSRVLDAAVRALGANGVLAISTPNPASLQFRLLGGRWMHVDAPRHLQLIPLGVLRGALSERGLTMVAMTTTDPVGKALNLMGWERALRPGSSRRANRISTLAAGALTVASKPIEARGLMGAAYTAFFAKRDLISRSDGPG